MGSTPLVVVIVLIVLFVLGYVWRGWIPEEAPMTRDDVPDRGATIGSIAGSEILARSPGDRRSGLEALGLAVGILGILLLVVLTLGPADTFGP